MERFERLYREARCGLNLSAFDADDVAQDAWIRIECDGARPRSAGAMYAFEAQIARNGGINFLRDSGRRTDRERIVARGEAEASGWDAADEDTRSKRLRVLMGALNPESQGLLAAIAHEGLSQEELARRMGVPSSTLKSRLRGIFDRLATALTSAEWSEEGERR